MNTEGFARGLKFLIGREDLRGEMGKRGRGFVEERYTRDRLINDMMAVYEGLASTSRAMTPEHRKAI
jgi:glycosyltransferase involved in cell wall biosynthesis